MLKDTGMIVRLSISQWTGRKTDKAATQKVADDFGVSRKVGNYRKSVVSKEALAEINSICTEARIYNYAHTLPWDDGGGRILPAKHFPKYTEKMRELRENFETAVKKFISDYSEYLEAAKNELKGLFNDGDYPAKNEIGGKFAFSVNVEPVPTSEDFRIKLAAKELNNVKKELEERLAFRQKEAMKDLYVRVITILDKFASKLKTKDSIFRNSLVENISEFLLLLPELKIEDDPELDKFVTEIKEKITVYEPDTLRQDVKARKEATKAANDILKRMAGYVGTK